MSDSLIDETAFTRAIHPMSFASDTNKPGGQAWTREFLQRYLTQAAQQESIHLRNMLRQVREYLFENKPVQAMDWLRSIEKYLEEHGRI